MHYCEYLNCTNFDASFKNVQNTLQNADFRSTACIIRVFSKNRQGKTFPVQNEITDEKALIFSADALSRELNIVEQYRLKEHARACIYDRAKAMLELFDCGREKHAKQIVDLLHVEKFKLSEVWATQKDVPAFLLFFDKTGNKSLEKNDLRKIPVSIKRISTATVSKVHKKNFLGVHKNQIEMCANAALLQLRTHPIELFKHPTETGCVSKVKSRERQKIPWNHSQQVFWNIDCAAFLKWLAGFVQICSYETASALKGSALVDLPVYVVLLNFSDAYMQWLALSGLTLVAFLSVECAAEEQNGNIELAEMIESL